MVLKNALIRYQFATLPDGINFQDNASKISYNTSEVNKKFIRKIKYSIYQNHLPVKLISIIADFCKNRLEISTTRLQQIGRFSQ